MGYNYSNEVIKRKYEKYLKEASGLSESSIKIARRSLKKIDEFLDNKDYANFGIEEAMEFKKWLKSSQISINSYVSICKQIQKFLSWLRRQKGFQNKIPADTIDYLNLSNKEDALSKCGRIQNIPTIEYVKKLVASIPPTSEVNIRDRALISFACLTGMRDSALASLPIGNVNIERMFVEQNPLDGVKTKFTKNITSKIFNFDKELVDCVIKWHEILKKKQFEPEDPFFPQAKPQKIEGNLSFVASDYVTPVFWNGGGMIRNVFNRRAKAANLEFYPPHKYRHLAIQLALDKAKSGEEIKAISQNFGHEYVATTFSVYGNYQPEQLIQKLSEIDNRNNNADVEKTRYPDLQEIIKSEVKEMTSSK